MLINTVAWSPFIQLILMANMALSGSEESIINVGKLLPLLLAEFGILFLWFRQVSQHHAGVDWRNFLLMPFGSLAVTVLYFHAAYLVLSGSQVSWKGRRYVVNTAKTISPMVEPARGPVLESYPSRDYLDTAIGTEAREVSTIS